ncbi:semaphorin-2A isoform X2 [Strongylocentrotus purpuratus]|uniref:Sema domain-containing protein n=1 Tax=Strongylocentrotus purpuratus TaxID=7668 RepID=A0A7M7N7K8_STRPU|nr:semaphorin-2A isoform X2 [Strongylocentrotus purpuratus]
MAAHRLLLTVLCFCAVLCLVHANLRANHTQKIITSMSCGFSVNEVLTSSSCNTNLQQVFKLLHVDSDRVLIGSTECLYVLDRNLTYINSTQLSLDGVDLANCEITNSQEKDFLCKNYITYAHGVNETTARVCGTYDSLNPRCWTCRYDGTTLQSCGVGYKTLVMPRTPTENFTVTVTNITDGSPDYYFLGGLDSSNVEKVLAKVNFVGDVSSAEPETDVNQENILKAPTNFVGSIERGEFIYFFYRETAIEYETIGQIIYSRVARVCKNDPGGVTNPLRDEFTTFLKTRLMCSVGADFPFIFNEIQDVVPSPSDENIIYGLFTTPSAGSSSTAICRYNMDEIDVLFKEDNRRGQASSTTLWQSVTKLAEDTEDSRSCSTPFHVDAYNYLEDYTLLNTNAPNCGLDTMCNDYSRATDEALAVFEGIRGQQLAVFNESSNSILVYVGTNNNTIYEASIDANEVLITRQIELEVDSVDETQRANKWPFGVSYLEANGGVIYGTLDNVAFRFDPDFKEDLKILDRSPDVSNFTFPIIFDDARIQIFKLFEGPAGSDINATFSGGLENHKCSQQVLKSTGAGKREFLHVLCEITALQDNINGIITVSSPLDSIIVLNVTVNVATDDSKMVGTGIAEEVKLYDEQMAKYRYEFRQWLANNVNCTDGIKDTCPAASSPGCL